MDNSKRKDKEPSIVDLTAYRKNRDEQRKREYERVLFNRILGVYSFAEKAKLNHVEVIDISFSGVRFREVAPEAPLKVGQSIALRFYFTPSSFLRLILEVKRVNEFEDGERKGLEYGCQLDKETKSFAVIQELVNFMQKYAEVACQDPHPPMIWF